MSESAPAPPPAETSAKSPLDKPLHLLTEDDIAQVTREDCRRYLKDKGMRRPSWNKSQAIQQVIMLKTLLETTPDGDSGSRKRLRISVPDCGENDNDCDNSLPESVPSEMCYELRNLVSEAARPPYQIEDLDRPDSSSGGFRGCFASPNNEPAQPRHTGSTNIEAGQMAIFYCGQINVYEDVPPDKAREILHIAASPMDISQEHPLDGTAILQPVSRVSNAVCMRDDPGSALLWPPFQAGECPSPSTREALVQRYLEKRKDRFKSMRK